MQYILDTCSFLWLTTEQSKLSAVALQAISNTTAVFHISAITITETHRLIRKGKVVLNTQTSLDAWFRAALVQHSVQCQPITLEIAHAAEVLRPI